MFRLLEPAPVQWNEGYNSLADYVVPLSSKLLHEDAEFGLFRVVVFKKTADNFKQGNQQTFIAVGGKYNTPTKFTRKIPLRLAC